MIEDGLRGCWCTSRVVDGTQQGNEGVRGDAVSSAVVPQVQQVQVPASHAGELVRRRRYILQASERGASEESGSYYLLSRLTTRAGPAAAIAPVSQ